MSLKALIVDDDPGVLFLHQLMIIESNFSAKTQTFNRAKPALEYLKSQKYEDTRYIIFLDINMPGMSGWDFLEKLSELTVGEHAYVVMVTSSINIADRKQAFTYQQVIDFVEKPLNLNACNKLKKNEAISYLFEE